MILQTAKVLALASLLAALAPARSDAQASARVDVRANVVNATPAQRALSSARWLLIQKRDARKERGLATIVVSREKRQVAIHYLKN